jgi:hypothetical protein
VLIRYAVGLGLSPFAALKRACPSGATTLGAEELIRHHFVELSGKEQILLFNQ